MADLCTLATSIEASFWLKFDNVSGGNAATNRRSSPTQKLVGTNFGSVNR